MSIFLLRSSLQGLAISGIFFFILNLFFSLSQYPFNVEEKKSYIFYSRWVVKFTASCFQIFGIKKDELTEDVKEKM